MRRKTKRRSKRLSQPTLRLPLWKVQILQRRKRPQTLINGSPSWFKIVRWVKFRLSSQAFCVARNSSTILTTSYFTLKATKSSKLARCMTLWKTHRVCFTHLRNESRALSSQTSLSLTVASTSHSSGWVSLSKNLRCTSLSRKQLQKSPTTHQTSPLMTTCSR